MRRAGAGTNQEREKSNLAKYLSPVAASMLRTFADMDSQRRYTRATWLGRGAAASEGDICRQQGSGCIGRS